MPANTLKFTENEHAELLEFAHNVRLLFDARKIYDGGIGTYIRNLLVGLTKLGLRPHILISKTNWSKLQALEHQLTAIVRPVFNDANEYSFENYFGLASKLNQSDYDIFHIPHYTLPYGIVIPTVITVHDLIHITHPQKFYYPWLARILIYSAIKRCDKVVTVSKASANSLMSIFTSLARKSLNIIENSISEDQLQIPDCNGDVSTNKYLLSVISTNKPHKGIKDLLLAYKEYLTLNDQPLELVLAGQAFSETGDFQEELIKLDLQNNVKIVGAVDKKILSQLYAEAHAIIIPSLAEGFGLVMLEAHAHNKPVAYRPVPALCDIALEQDIQAVDFSISALTTALNLVTKYKSNNGEISTVFKQQVQNRFNIEANSISLLATYRDVIKERNN